MADVVWETLVMYGIEDWVRTTVNLHMDKFNMPDVQVWVLMMDNATNMDTLVDGIARHAHAAGIDFNAEWARLCCMPHTIHLSALEVSSVD